MPSQTDIDQGGTNRQWVRQYLGPTIGWVLVPSLNFLSDPPSTTTLQHPGTYSLDLSTNYVRVQVAGAVTIILPSAKATGGITQPGTAVKASITILDAGGNAAAHPITIQPISVAETIMGLTQIQITSNFGGFILQPVSTNAFTGWVNAQ